jgi:tRNA 2-thiouridine synthesizing protein D
LAPTFLQLPIAAAITHNAPCSRKKFGKKFRQYRERTRSMSSLNSAEPSRAVSTFALMVLGAPVSSQSVTTAYEFARAAVDAGHRVLRVFFYHDGVYNGNRLQIPAADDAGMPARWSELARQHQIDLVVCVASALKRGVVDAGEAQRYGKGADNLQAGFELSGLGQWVEACLLADRAVTFGP